MKIILPLIISAAIVIAMLFNSNAIANVTYGSSAKMPLSLEQQKKICASSLPSLISITGSSLQRLSDMTFQVSIILKEFNIFYQNQQKKLVTPDLYAWYANTIENYRNSTVSSIQETQQKINSLNCSSEDVVKQIELIRASLSLSIKNFDLYKQTVKSLMQEMQKTSQSGSSSATPTTMNPTIVPSQ